MQWQVIDRAFSGRSTVILIGDPEAGDLRLPRRRHRHLPGGGRRPPASKKTLGTNWRSDSALRRPAAGRAARRSTRRPDDRRARRRGAITEATGWRAPRTTSRSGCGSCSERRWAAEEFRTCPSARSARAHRRRPRRRHPRTAGQRCDVRRRAAAGPRHRGDRGDGTATPTCASRRCAMRASRSVYTGDSDVFASEAAGDWLCLLEAFDQPHRAGDGPRGRGDDVLRRDRRDTWSPAATR